MIVMAGLAAEVMGIFSGVFGVKWLFKLQECARVTAELTISYFRRQSDQRYVLGVERKED